MEVNSKKVWTSNDIAQEWINQKWSEETDYKKVAAKIVSKFKDILQKKLKLEGSELNWFKEDLPSSCKGQFRFNGFASNSLYELFKLFDNTQSRIVDRMTFEQDLEYYIIDILPNCSDIQCFEKRKQRLSEAVKTFCNKTWENNYPKRWMKEFEEKILSVIKNMGIRNKKTRQQLYELLYEKMKTWRDKWLFILDKVDCIRKAESFEKVWIICGKDDIPLEECISFCETGKTENNKLLEKYNDFVSIESQVLFTFLQKKYKESEKMSKENCDESKTFRSKIKGNECKDTKSPEPYSMSCNECCEDCKDLFNEILERIFNGNFKTDLEYMFKELFEDLYDIREQMYAEVALEWNREAKVGNRHMEENGGIKSNKGKAEQVKEKYREKMNNEDGFKMFDELIESLIIREEKSRSTMWRIACDHYQQNYFKIIRH